MGQRLAAFALFIVGMATPAWPTDQTVSSNGATSVLAFFEEHSSTTIEEFLTRMRPPPPDVGARADVIADLPKEGELGPTQDETAKLDAAESILRYHNRHGVIVFKVIDVGHAFVGLHARAVLLASRDALALVSAEEFSAIVAHEIAHDFVWDDYQHAMQWADHARMQTLELRCDGIAVLTLRRLGLEPEHLVRAIRKMTRFNQRRGAIARAADYLPLKDRIAFIHAIEHIRWPAAHASIRSPVGQSSSRCWRSAPNPPWFQSSQGSGAVVGPRPLFRLPR